MSDVQAPWLAGSAAIGGAAFPPFDTEQVEITGAGAGPVMVVGNTGDPATPFEGSRVMAETLEEGFFVTA